jgi:hypothetical protein
VKLRDQYKKALDTYIHAESNADTVRVNVKAEAFGSPVDRKRGWEQVKVDLVVNCVAPINLKEQLFQMYGLDRLTDQIGRSAIFRNEVQKKVYVHARVGQKLDSCSNGSRSQQNFGLAAGGRVEIPLDTDQNVCFLWSYDVPHPAGPNLCTASLGDQIIFDAPKECFQM